MKILLIHNPFVWYRPATWLYWAIRMATKSEWNHAVIWYEENGLEFVADANFKGVFTRANRRARTTSLRKVAYLQLPEIAGVDYLGRVKARFGDGYDFGVYWRYITKKRKKRPGRLYCMEYVAQVYDELFPDHVVITGRTLEPYIVSTDWIT